MKSKAEELLWDTVYSQERINGIYKNKRLWGLLNAGEKKLKEFKNKIKTIQEIERK